MRALMNKGLVVLFTACFSVMTMSLNLRADESHEHEHLDAHHDLKLKIGWVMGTIPLKVRFSLKNESDKPFTTTPIATNRNKIIIVTPEGKKFEHHAWKDGVKEVKVASGEEKLWDFPIEPLFGLYHIKKAGFYEVYWSVEGVESPKMFVFTEGK